MKKYKVPPEIRQQFTDRIKNEGLSVTEASKEAGVHETTVYGWLGKGAESVPCDETLRDKAETRTR